jgi:DNA-binding PadR family transcriptional regulator
MQYSASSLDREEISVQLSPTSYALLGLLSLRPWTTYELTQQAQRSLRYLYPRAERHLYAEAKRLADAGLARTESKFTGKRPSTTYAITTAGRKALQDWLRTPPAPPVLEAEVLLRSFFGEFGRREDFLAALESARTQAIATQQELAEMAQRRLDGTAPFPERVGVVVLTMRFVTDFHRLLEDWTNWAADEIATWKHPDGRDWKAARNVMADIANHTRPPLNPHKTDEPHPA